MGRPFSKMTEEMVDEAIRRVQSGEKVRKVAADFGIVPMTLHGHINRRKLIPRSPNKLIPPKVSLQIATVPKYKRPGPPPHEPKRKAAPEPEPPAMTPAQLRHFLTRGIDGNGSTWNAIQVAAYVMKAIDAGVKESVILNKTGLGTLKWFKQRHDQGEHCIWAWVMGDLQVHHPDVVGPVEVTIMDPLREQPAMGDLAVYQGTPLTHLTPAGELALARLAVMLPAPPPLKVTQATPRQLAHQRFFTEDGDVIPTGKLTGDFRTALDGALPALPLPDQDPHGHIWTPQMAAEALSGKPVPAAERYAGLRELDPPPQEYLEEEAARLAVLRLRP